MCLALLPLGQKPGQGAFASGCERDQPFAQTVELGERHMRILAERAIQMCTRNELAEVGIAKLVFGQQHQPVDPAAEFRWTRNR